MNSSGNSARSWRHDGERCLERLRMGAGREVRERNTKFQTPSPKEIPESKHQKPSSKHQKNPKFQAPDRGPRFELGASLVFGVWCLGLSCGLLSNFAVTIFHQNELEVGMMTVRGPASFRKTLGPGLVALWAVWGA